MFTGIIREIGQIHSIEKMEGLTRYSVSCTQDFVSGIETGASVAVAGVCQTLVKIEGGRLYFDAIQETLNRTNLNYLEPGKRVNMERSARVGDEIGGHVLSGHVYGMAQISKVDKFNNNSIVTFQGEPQWMKYFFSKGYIALDGCSLTLVDVDPSSGKFTVHLIPETLVRSTFGAKKEGDWINVEFDSQTQTIVETVERVLERHLHGR